MLKFFAIVIAIFIAIVNVSANPDRSAKRAVNGKLLLKRPAVIRVGPSTTYLKAGLTTAEVVRLLGQPIAVIERSDNNVTVVTYEFARSDHRVLVADFVNDALTTSRTESRNQLANADL